MKTTLCLLILSLGLTESALAQSDSLKWAPLFKTRDSTEIVYDDYVREFSFSSYSPLISIDTISVSHLGNLSRQPFPIQGLKAFADSMKYPLLAWRAGLEGRLVLSTTIDKLGLPQNIKVEWSNGEIFNQEAISVLKKTRFSPASTDLHPIESNIVIPISFAFHKRRNIDIDQIEIEKGSYAITLNTDGTVFYDGHVRVQKLGKWKASIDKEQFTGIASLIFATRFFSLQPRLKTGMSSTPTLTIMAKTKQGNKSVTTDLYLPLWQIALLVDYMTEKLNWEKVK